MDIEKYLLNFFKGSKKPSLKEIKFVMENNKLNIANFIIGSFYTYETVV